MKWTPNVDGWVGERERERSRMEGWELVLELERGKRSTYGSGRWLEMLQKKWVAVESLDIFRSLWKPNPKVEDSPPPSPLNWIYSASQWMYKRGIGSFEIVISFRRVAFLHRLPLLSSQLKLVREAARYLYSSNVFQYNASFLSMGTDLDGRDHENPIKWWGRIGSSFSFKKYPNPSLELLLLGWFWNQGICICWEFPYLPNIHKGSHKHLKGEREGFSLDFCMSCCLKLFLLPHSRLHQVRIIYQHHPQSSLLKS